MKIDNLYRKFRPALLVFSMAAIFFSTCAKGPGTGGEASIYGKIYVLNYRSYSPTQLPPYFYYLDAQYYGADETVYLVYGEDTTYSRTVKTREDGSFYFDYLNKGKYKVYAKSRDTTAAGTTKEIVKMIEVEITKRKQEVKLDSIVVLK